MKRHMYYSILIIAILLIVPATSYAAFATNLTLPFGGRVITPNLGVATCYGVGTGPVLLSSNISSLGSAIISATDSSQGTTSQVANVGSGVYGAIPYYTSLSFAGNALGLVSNLPKTGDWILGRASIIPNFSRCTITGTYVPFPVRDTSNFKTSR